MRRLVVTGILVWYKRTSCAPATTVSLADPMSKPLLRFHLSGTLTSSEQQDQGQAEDDDDGQDEDVITKRF